jgi:Holliday junction resolvasome RuvABC DNA-binding subunit
MDEKDIHHAFTKGDMSFRDAVTALQKLGYDAQEADQIVSEWADDAEAERIASDGLEGE